MDVNQVLASTLSPDAPTRKNAEDQLLAAAQQDFSLYLQTLAGELANENAAPYIRSAAGLALKNSLSARDIAQLRHVQARWVEQVHPAVKERVKETALATLSSSPAAAHTAAQFITSIAAIELPRNEWPQLMPTLVNHVSEGKPELKRASLTTIGFICEADEPTLRESLSMHSNAILTAVVQGARKEEPDDDTRISAITALGDAMEFVRSNFENDGERNYIMQVVCEATQAEDPRIQSNAFGCLDRIMGLYYDKMRLYMEQALYRLTIFGMKSEDEDVAKLAIEFWCTVCEEEMAIEDDNAAADESGAPLRPLFNFARVATAEVVPTLLELLTAQDENAIDDDYNVSRAAYQALELYAQCVGNTVIAPVLTFVEQNLRGESWNQREAAVAAFGAIMDGPDLESLQPFVAQALPVLIAMLTEDDNVLVRDSCAYALGRICDCCSDCIDVDTQLQPLISCLFGGVLATPKIASSSCWALMNIGERFAGEPNAQTNALSQHFNDSIEALLSLTARSEPGSEQVQIKIAAYELLSCFVTNSANDCLPKVAALSYVVLQRLEPTFLESVSLGDQLTLEETISSLVNVTLAIIQRLEGEIKPQADSIMAVLINLLQSASPKSSVPETAFSTVGGLAGALGPDFLPYMEHFMPFLIGGLSKRDDDALCTVAVGLVSDIVTALGETVRPFCNSLMETMLENPGFGTFPVSTKPAVLQTFGDIAQAIGAADFEVYLNHVAAVLISAADVTTQTGLLNSIDVMDLIASLREGIMDAWSGILLAYKGTPQAQHVQPFVEPIFRLLNAIAADPHRTENLLRSSVGVISDLADTFPSGEYASYFQNDFITLLTKEARNNRKYGNVTVRTARAAAEQVRRQVSLHVANGN